MVDLLWVFSYDVTDNRMRRHVADALEDQAARVQGSVFEFRGSELQAYRLFDTLSGLVATGDSVRLYHVPQDAIRRCRTTGNAAPVEESDFWLV